MAFCQQCGSQVDGKFCPSCGAPNPELAGSAASSTGSASQTGGLTDNVVGALCYLAGLVTGILFLVLAPHNQNPQIRFHAFQAIFFNVALIVVWILLSILAAITSVFALLLIPVYLLVGLGTFALWIFLMWRAYNNQPLVLPVIGPLAQQQAGTR